MRELTQNEIDDVAGGLNEWQQAGIAVMGLGFMTPVTSGFGFFVGGSMLLMGTYGALLSYH